MTLREKIEGLTRYGIAHRHANANSPKPDGGYLARSEVLAAVEEWEADKAARPLDFGDYCWIEQKRFGVPNEIYQYKVIGRGRANHWRPVPVSHYELYAQGEICDVVKVICCGVSETQVETFRLQDVSRDGKHWPGTAKPAPPVGSSQQLGAAEQFEEIKELPADEFRPGLPAEAIRKSCRFFNVKGLEWLLEFSGAQYRWSNEDRWLYIEDAPGLPLCCYRPHGSTWSAVELLAAKALGEEGGKAGREPIGDANLKYVDAYRTAYAAAKGTT